MERAGGDTADNADFCGRGDCADRDSGVFWFLKLETEVRRDGLYVRYYPFHIQFKKFGADDLSEYYARKYRPIWEYGGWGIRCSFGKGKAYNVSGNKGVQLVFKNGKRLLIGSQRVEELEEAIRSIMASVFAEASTRQVDEISGPSKAG